MPSAPLQLILVNDQSGPVGQRPFLGKADRQAFHPCLLAFFLQNFLHHLTCTSVAVGTVL